MFPFLSFLNPFSGVIKLVAIATIVGTIGWYVHDYLGDKETIVALRYELSERNNRIKVLDASIVLLNGTITTLDEVARTRNADLKDMCAILGDVDTDKDPDADKPVGGIIGKTLKRLKDLGK